MATPDPRATLEDVVARLKKAGADAADAIMSESTSLSASYRMGKLEDIERSESYDLGLRAIVGQRQAVVSSNDHNADALSDLVERVVAMAKLAPEDPYCGLAPEDRLVKSIPDLDLVDPVEPASDTLADRARDAEAAALAVEGVTNSEGGGASWGKGGVRLATSAGFYGEQSSSSHSVFASVVAGADEGMERDYDSASALHFADLQSPEDIGRSAGERAVRRLNPRKLDSQQAPVVYDNRLSRGLVRALAGAINGAAIARGVSFLKDKMDEQLFPEGINIIDDPLRKRALASSAFDGEGVANEALRIIDQGRLTTWILNSAQARQLKLETNGRATRGTGGPPGSSTTNLFMEAGTLSFSDLISDISGGLLVTDMFSPSVNGNTGDYSAGVSGFWIENGEPVYPISEVTVAGNLLDMFKNITPADDLEFRAGTNAPSIRIEGMTIGGN